MITKVQKWGNSQGLRISKELLSNADINVGDAVDIAVHDGALVVTPIVHLPDTRSSWNRTLTSNKPG